tara:strand:+ start:785 stop:1174 length:390 start_codon:yes stop_codon:yes gene_type:complete
MMDKNKPMTSPLKSAKGLGSAKHGLSHWIAQRVTAIALVPLTIWFVSLIAFMKSSNYETAIETVSNPLNATLFLLLIIATFWHAQLGLQVVIEDYIANKMTRMTLIIITKFIFAIIGVLSALSVLRIVL